MVGGPSEVFASSKAAIFCAGMNPLSLKDLVAGCLTDARCLLSTHSMLDAGWLLARYWVLARCRLLARCWMLAECSLDACLLGAGDCCQGLFGEFLGQHVLEEEGVAEDVTTPHTVRLFQETIKPFETMVLPP